MTRGRKPKPTQLKKLAGNPGKRKLNNAEPRVQKIKPRRPSWMTDGGKKVWNHIVPRLFAAGVVSEINVHPLAAMCEAWATFVAATEEIKTAKMTYETDKGYKHQNPVFGIRAKALDQARRIWIEFGMTPSSMSRLHVDPPEEPDEFDKWKEGALFGNEDVPVKVKNE